MSSQDEVTTTTEPWEGARPHILEFLKRARSQADNPMEMYAGDMLAPQSRMSLDAINKAGEFGMDDSADALRAFAGEAMGGFASNPMLDQTYDAAARAVTRNFQRAVAPGVDSSFNAAGRFGSAGSGRSMGVAQNELAGSLNDLATQFYYSDYENRMGDRFRGAGLLGQADQMDTGRIGVLAGAGQTQDAWAQAKLDELIGRFNFGQQEEGMRLDRFGDRIRGSTQGFQSSTGPGPGGNAGLSAGLGAMSILSTILSAIPATAPAGIAMGAGTGIAGGSIPRAVMPGLPSGGFFR